MTGPLVSIGGNGKHREDSTSRLSCIKRKNPADVTRKAVRGRQPRANRLF
jgi:hypothetical protein